MRCYLAVLAAIVAALALTTTPAVQADIVDVLVLSMDKNAPYETWDDFAQAEDEVATFREAIYTSGVSREHDLRLWGPRPITSVRESEVSSMKDLQVRLLNAGEVNRLLDETGTDIAMVYTGIPLGPGDSPGIGAYRFNIQHRGGFSGGPHQMVHRTSMRGNEMHADGWCGNGVMGIDAYPNFCPGAEKIVPRISAVNAEAVETNFPTVAAHADPQTTPGWLATPELPGFEFKVWITPRLGQTVSGTAEPCIPETLCVSGALEGRPEVFVKIIGPRPNGFLWVQISRFTPSTVEVWVRQLSTGETQEYFLRHVPAGFGHLDVSGLQDREAFLP